MVLVWLKCSPLVTNLAITPLIRLLKVRNLNTAMVQIALASTTTKHYGTAIYKKKDVDDNLLMKTEVDH